MLLWVSSGGESGIDLSGNVALEATNDLSL
jgi:hypothetical protein